MYGITSLSAQQAGPDKVLRLLGGHWQIEKGLHWRRDETLGEDYNQVRSGQAPAVVATLNKLVLG